MVFEIMVKIVLAGNSNSEVEVLGKLIAFINFTAGSTEKQYLIMDYSS